MSMKATRRFVTTLFFFSALATAQTDTSLPLKHGVWVMQSTPCNDAPNAAIVTWNGVGFASAHSSQCTSKVVSKTGSFYSVSTTCNALGDGTPTKPETLNWQLARKSATEIVLTEGGAKTPYRWCSAR